MQATNSLHRQHWQLSAKSRPRFKLGNKQVDRVTWAKVAWDAAINNELLKLQRRAAQAQRPTP